MLTLHTKVSPADLLGRAIDGELVLPYDQREKCRLRARLASGEEVAVFTVRGTVLRDGDCLRGDDGRMIQVRAACEPTYDIRCATPLLLARCAFHLGNRHTQAQIGEHFIRIRVDPVLRTMLEGLGARVEPHTTPFEPEPGAYGGGHGHGEGSLLAPVPLRQKIHRPSDPVPV